MSDLLSLAGLSSKSDTSPSATSSNTNVFGIKKSGSSRMSNAQFKKKALSGKIVPIDSQKRLRKVDLKKQVREHLRDISTYEKVKIKDSDGSVRTVKLKKGDLPDMVERSGLIGKSYGAIARQLTKGDKKGFKYKDKKGKVIEVDFSSSKKNIQDTRKITAAAVIKDPVPEKSGPSDKQVERNIRYQRHQRLEEEEAGMANKLKGDRDGKKSVRKMEDTTSKRIGAKGKKYGISAHAQEVSTDDLRSDDAVATINTIAANGEKATASGTDNSKAKDISAAIGAKQQEKEESDDTPSKAVSGADASHLNFSNYSTNTRVGNSLNENAKFRRDPRGELKNVFDISNYRKDHPLMQDDDTNAPIASQTQASQAQEENKLHQASPDLSDNLDMFSDNIADDYPQDLKEAV